MLSGVQIVCDGVGNTTLSTLEAWLSYAGPDGGPADYVIQPDSTVQVAFAVLPQVQQLSHSTAAQTAGTSPSNVWLLQAVTGLCSGEVVALAPAEANVVLHNVSFQIADIALPAGDRLWLAQSLFGVYTHFFENNITVQIQANLTNLPTSAASFPFYENR